MTNTDWRDVYKLERQRPGYVIEDGKPPIKIDKPVARKPRITAHPKMRHKAA